MSTGSDKGLFTQPHEEQEQQEQQEQQEPQAPPQEEREEVEEEESIGWSDGNEDDSIADEFNGLNPGEKELVGEDLWLGGEGDVGDDVDDDVGDVGDGDDDNDKHDWEARRRLLQKSAAELSPSLSLSERQRKGNKRKGSGTTSRAKRTRAVAMHQTYLLTLLSRALSLNEQCEAEALQEFLRECMLTGQLQLDVESISIEPDEVVEAVKRFLKIIPDVSQVETGFGASEARQELLLPVGIQEEDALESSIRTNRASRFELVQTVVAIMRLLKLPSRLVFPLPTIAPSASKSAIPCTTNNASAASSSTANARKQSGFNDGATSAQGHLSFWAELWSNKQHKWLMLHPGSWSTDVSFETLQQQQGSDSGDGMQPKGGISQHSQVKLWNPYLLSANRVANRNSQAFGAWTVSPYIVAIGNFGHAVDVTRKYSERWTHTSRKRWTGFLDSTQRHKQQQQQQQQQKQQQRQQQQPKEQQQQLKEQDTAPFVRSKYGDWWNDAVLEPLRRRAITKILKYHENSNNILVETFSDWQLEKEFAEMAASVESESMPTNERGFHRHPRYMLNKFITSKQAVRPGARPIAYFKGIAVWDRSVVGQLRTCNGWFHQGRKVLDNQLAHPFKYMKNSETSQKAGRSATKRKGKRKRRSGKASYSTGNNRNNNTLDPNRKRNEGKSVEDNDDDGSGDDDDDDDDDEDFDDEDGREVDDREEDDKEEEQVVDLVGGTEKKASATALYAVWQTEPYVAPSVGEDGSVPKNRHGNVELWNERCIPGGAVHLNSTDYPYAYKIALGNNIDAPNAVVGFTKEIGKWVPKIDGVVVAEVHAQTLKDGSRQIQRDKEREAMEARSKEVAHKWTRLARGLLLSQRAKNRYAHHANASVSVSAGTTSSSSSSSSSSSTESSAETIPESSSSSSSTLPSRLRASKRARICPHEFEVYLESPAQGLEEQGLDSSANAKSERCKHCGATRKIEVV